MNKIMPKPIRLFAWCSGDYQPEIHIDTMPDERFDARQNAIQLARLLMETTPNTSFEVLVEFLGRQIWQMLQYEHTAELMSNNPTFIRDHIRGFIHMLAHSK